MLKVFYGADPVSAREAVTEFCLTQKAGLRILETGELPGQIQTDSLFGNPEITLAHDLLKTANEKQLESWQNSSSILIILETELTDKLKIKLPAAAQTREFSLPAGGLVEWLVGRVKKHGAVLPPALSSQIIFRCGINEKKGISMDALWLLEQEAQKLAAHSFGQTISAEAVNLLTPDPEGAVFSLVDNAAKGNVKAAISECVKLYENKNDDAGVTLQIIGALADTLRGLRLIQLATAEAKNLQEVFGQTQWPAWKARKLQALALMVRPGKVGAALDKLASLDAEVKSSGLPPRVVLELIIGSLIGKVV